MANVKRTSMFLDRDLVTQAASALGTESVTETVHAAMRHVVAWTRDPSWPTASRRAPSAFPRARSCGAGMPTRPEALGDTTAWIALRRGRPAAVAGVRRLLRAGPSRCATRSRSSCCAAPATCAS